MNGPDRLAPRDPAVELSIVIPSWNTRELLATCLERLAAADKPPSEVIVVDNGSADGSAAMVAARHPGAILVRNARNEGFARGCNQGLRLARGRLALLLNTDTEVAPDAIRRLVLFLAAHPEHGAVAPRLVHAGGHTQRTVMAFPNLRSVLFFGTPLERWFPRSRELVRYFMRDWDQETSRDVDQPPAACLLVRREVFEAIGLLDEKLWLFFNDVDFSRRMAQAGWRTHYLADAVVVHHVGASTAQFARFVFEYQKNRLFYYRKHHGRLAGPWVKACGTLALADYLWTQLARRWRGGPTEPLGPILADYWRYLLL
ncbi:MAG: glycosyltransferase family 2 protein [Planctomycetota bacterium]